MIQIAILLNLIYLSFQSEFTIKCEQGKYLVSKNKEVFLIQNKEEQKISFMPDPQFLAHAKKQYKIEQATTYKNDIYFMGKDFIIFSSDCVKTYQIYDIPQSFHKIIIDDIPHKSHSQDDHHYDIAGLHKKHQKGHSDLYDVYISCDNGQNWELIEEKVKSFNFKNYNFIKEQIKSEQLKKIGKLPIMNILRYMCAFSIIVLFMCIFQNHIYYFYRVVQSKLEKQKNYPTFNMKNVKYQNIDNQDNESIYN